MAFRCCVYARSRFCAESSFEEYKLDNGLHVILHNDPSVYCNHISDVGTKTKNLKELVLSNFFEHLLFEGTENIKRRMV
jgi:predicted Zn-dependent peptidase